MRVPPRWVRRVLLAPGVVLAALVSTVTLPVWFAVSTLLSLVRPGVLRIPRLLWVITFYLLWDSAAVISLFGLWVASGFGWRIRGPRMQRAHFALSGWLTRSLYRQARWSLRLRVRIQGDDLGVAPGHPLIVVSRHAGPGDSMILVHALINWYDREPRVVLKDTLQWDPGIDIMLNRLPSRFIAPSPFAAAGDRYPGLSEQVGQLARGLDGDGALLLFPEGGNFTAARRLVRIERLRGAGLHAMARRAEAMRNVMAPAPGGLLAALDAAPDACVLFVAHTGLEHLPTVGQLWRELPMDRRIVLRGWLVQSPEVPAGRTERIEWLFAWWERIDAWVGQAAADAGAAPAPVPEAAPAPVPEAAPAPVPEAELGVPVRTEAAASDGVAAPAGGRRWSARTPTA